MEYTLQDTIATLRFDDGKANVVGHTFIDDLNGALDRAQSEAQAVIIRGRDGMFSAGFDLAEFKKGPEAGMKLAGRGFELLLRLYGYPLPLVAACSGHAVAMGAFITMACDSRVGVDGDFRFSLPETAIGMSLPPLLVALAASRISRRHMTRVALQSEAYGPREAIDAGFIDEVVQADELDQRVQEIAERLAALPGKFYAENKLSIRAHTLQVMRDNLKQA